MQNDFFLWQMFILFVSLTNTIDIQLEVIRLAIASVTDKYQQQELLLM